MNAHNEQHDSASPVVKQNLTTQPAAAQEAVAWQRRYIGATRGNRPVEWHTITKDEFEATKAWKWADRYEVRALYAAPVTAAQEGVGLIVEALKNSQPFAHIYPEAMKRHADALATAEALLSGAAPVTAAPAMLNLANGVQLPLVADEAGYRIDPAYAQERTPAAPGIDLRSQMLRLAEKWEKQAAEHGVRQFTGNDLPGMWEKADLIGGATDVEDSPKGGSEVVSDAMIHAALRVQYARAGSLWTGSEANPDFTDMRHILSAAMQAQAGDAEVQP